jgi:hypothetical protein
MSQFIESYLSPRNEEKKIKFIFSFMNLKYGFHILPTLSLRVGIDKEKKFESISLDFKFINILVRICLEKKYVRNIRKIS